MYLFGTYRQRYSSEVRFIYIIFPFIYFLFNLCQFVQQNIHHSCLWNKMIIQLFLVLQLQYYISQNRLIFYLLVHVIFKSTFLSPYSYMYMINYVIVARARPIANYNFFLINTFAAILLPTWKYMHNFCKDFPEILCGRSAIVEYCKFIIHCLLQSLMLTRCLVECVRWNYDDSINDYPVRMRIPNLT
jgi:hypothetical protein